MRRRALVLLIATLAAGALTLEATAVSAGASVSARSHHSVVEKKKKKKKAKTAKCDEAAIRTAFDYFLNGTKGYTAAQAEPYIQFMDTNAPFKAQFEASDAANAASKATTNIQVNTITCAKNGKSAVVAYDLVIGGSVAKGLAPPGNAVLDKGTWKVAATTVCDLQALGDPSVTASGPCADIINGVTK